MRKNPVPPQRSTLPSRGCVAVLAAARIAEDHGQKGYRVRIIEGLGRYPYPRAGDHTSGTRTGAPSPIPERPGALDGKTAAPGPTAPRRRGGASPFLPRPGEQKTMGRRATAFAS